MGSVVRIESVRTLLTIAAFYSLYIQHIDAKSAFLNGQSDVELYVQQPEGFVDQRYPDHALKLNKSLYGLKQAPRIWYLLLCQTITALGFRSCDSDPSIYVHDEQRTILAVYVDDILVIGSQSTCAEFYDIISKSFQMEDKGAVKSFLGLNIVRAPDGAISINQSGYIDRMIEHFHMQEANPAKTPLESSLPLKKATDTDKRTT